MEPSKEAEIIVRITGAFPEQMRVDLRRLMNCSGWTVEQEEVIVHKWNGPNGPAEIYVGIRQDFAGRGEDAK
jgi:hypothetical protein